MANNWAWFHKLGSPRWFYQNSSKWLPWLAPISIGLLLVGLVWGLAFAPEDAKQGNSFRIFYLHVPAAVIAMVAYYVMAIAGAVGLIWKMKMADMVMKSIAPIGAVMTAIALITGAIWGKPTWGTYWVWDARLTSVLVLFFLYLGVVALQGAYRNQDAANKACAVLALVGTINIPIIYKSVDWWFTLHQPATIKFTEASTIHPDMAVPFWIAVAGFYGFFALVTILSARAEVIYRERRTSWVRELLDK